MAWPPWAVTARLFGAVQVMAGYVPSRISEVTSGQGRRGLDVFAGRVYVGSRGARNVSAAEALLGTVLVYRRLAMRGEARQGCLGDFEARWFSSGQCTVWPPRAGQSYRGWAFPFWARPFNLKAGHGSLGAVYLVESLQGVVGPGRQVKAERGLSRRGSAVSVYLVAVDHGQASHETVLSFTARQPRTFWAG
jgi:hypothetical protein